MASGKAGRQEPQRDPAGLAVAYGALAGLLAGLLLRKKGK